MFIRTLWGKTLCEVRLDSHCDANYENSCMKCRNVNQGKVSQLFPLASTLHASEPGKVDVNVKRTRRTNSVNSFEGESKMVSGSSAMFVNGFDCACASHFPKA